MKRRFKLPPHRDRIASDIDAELEFHIGVRIEELVAGGMQRADAEREVMRHFGDRRRVQEELERIAGSVERQRAWRDGIAAIARDTHYAVRALIRRPLHAVAIIGTLALALGANTAIFAVVDAVLIRPFPLPQIGRLAVVMGDLPQMNLRRTGVSVLEALDLSERKDLFDAAAAIQGQGAITVIGDIPARVAGSATVGDFWGLTGVKPLYGRLYRPDESQFGSAPVIVLSYALWQRLSGDTAIVGRTIALNDSLFQVVGILPRGFTYPRNATYWRPQILDSVVLNQTRSRGTITWRFIGRMAPGVSVERLGVVLPTVADEWHRNYTSNYVRGGHTLIAESFIDNQAGGLKAITIALFFAVLFVLLIACANIAGLQLVQAVGRSRELAVRAALGAGRAAIARQAVIESALLAIAGGIAGIALGKLGLWWLSQANVTQFPALRTLRLSGPVVMFTLGITGLAALLFGLAPAVRAMRTDVNAALRSLSRGATGSAGRHRFLRAGVMVQHALVLVLLVGAGLTTKSLSRLVDTDLGFNPDRVVIYNVVLPGARYTRQQRVSFFSALYDRLRHAPGVEATGFALGVPFTGGGGSTSYSLKGPVERQGQTGWHANQAFVYGDYFATMGIPIARGRAFGADDHAGAPVKIVDESLVREAFGNADPLGTVIEHGTQGAIIGVARNVRQFSIDETAHPLVYHDYGHAGYVSAMTGVIRSSLPIADINGLVRAALADLDPRLPFDGVQRMTELVDRSIGHRRFAAHLFGGFAAMALTLALLGMYAVMTYVVGHRTREIGIRLALGAQRSQVGRLVARDGVLMAGAGLGIGLVTYSAFGRVLQALLYRVTLADPLTLAGAIAIASTATLLACWIPVRRAVRVDPVVTLRNE